MMRFNLLEPEGLAFILGVVFGAMVLKVKKSLGLFAREKKIREGFCKKRVFGRKKRDEEERRSFYFL